MSLDTGRDSKEIICRPLKTIPIKLRNCDEFMGGRPMPRVAVHLPCAEHSLIIAGVCVGALLASSNSELPCGTSVNHFDSSTITVVGYGGETGVHEDIGQPCWLYHTKEGPRAVCPV